MLFPYVRKIRLEIKAKHRQFVHSPNLIKKRHEIRFIRDMDKEPADSHTRRSKQATEIRRRIKINLSGLWQQLAPGCLREERNLLKRGIVP